MGFVDWLTGLFGGTQVKAANQANQDLNALHQQLASGNYQGAMATGQAISNQAAPAGAAPAFVPMSQDAHNAMMQQAMANSMAAQQAEMNQRLAANPQLMEPIEGITIEQYAEVAAQASAGIQGAQFDQLLAQRGMDRAKYDRVSQGWNARMSQDASATLATIYGRAFGGSGAGQFGAAGAAGAQVLSGVAATGQVAGVGGGEPVSWEKYNEIGGAQRAWAQSGRDVNAMLKQAFGISALDWSNMSQFWMARMMTDPQKMMEMEGLQQRWAQHYAAPKADSDLAF
jgi:hypothetical protein